MRHGNRQSVLFEGLSRKPIHASLNADSLSSEGGVTLVAGLDRKLGLTDALVRGLEDCRQQGKVSFSLLELLRQRIYSIALGYEDAIDATKLARDPMLKLSTGRDPRDDEDLASQPTISRFENTPTAREVAQLGRRLERHVIDRLSRLHRGAKVVTLDFDSTVDPTHGRQQLSLFNGFYGTHCYLPLVGFISIDGQEEQHLFHARLRPGRARCHRGLIPVLRRTVAMIRRKWPKARILIRLDGGFYHPHVLDVLEELRTQYAVGMPGNPVLDDIAEQWMVMSRTLAGREQRTISLYGEGSYRAGSWTSQRRVVLKAEVIHFEGRTQKDNQRYIITNRRRMTPANLYRWYCGRGDSENRIKELKHDLAIDRTSCSNFVANQFRVLMTSAAFVLFQVLRWSLRKTKAARASVGRIRGMLLKVAVRVVVSCRRIVCHLPIHLPWEDVWRAAAKAVGARPA
jgi:hypothetical protein